MAARKRRATRTASAGRARASGRNPTTVAAADLAEAHRRARAATTPVAKAATKAVLESKQALYSAEANRKAAALAGKGKQPASTQNRRGARGKRRTR